MPEKMPLQSMPDYNLFGLEKTEYESSRVVVLPVPYDSTATYKSGAREGPQAIISASRNVELYSCELGADISKIGIHTLPSMAPDLGSPERMVAMIKKEVALMLEDSKIPLLLGGEHTITIGALQAFREKGKDMSILCFDAHSDTREELFGTKYMHATVMARAKELYPDTFQVGIRSVDAGYANKMSRDKALFMDDIQSLGMDDVISKVLDNTGENVYLSVDFDVLDPSEMPSVGTPEPNGLRFAEMFRIIKEVGAKRNLMGLDFTELCPIPYLHAPDYLAAKLIYLTLGCFLSRK